jgi:hypothetical protein
VSWITSVPSCTDAGSSATVTRELSKAGSNVLQRMPAGPGAGSSRGGEPSGAAAGRRAGIGSDCATCAAGLAGGFLTWPPGSAWSLPFRASSVTAESRRERPNGCGDVWGSRTRSDSWIVCCCSSSPSRPGGCNDPHPASRRAWASAQGRSPACGLAHRCCGAFAIPMVRTESERLSSVWWRGLPRPGETHRA